MSLFEQLIPKQITDLLNLDQVELDITLLGKSASGKYPKSRILINDVLIFDGTVIDYQTVNFSARFTEDISSIQVKIEHYDKDDNAAVKDSDGNLIENQCITLQSVFANGVDIVKNQMIYNLGYYYQNLSAEKKEYFLANGIDTGPTHSLSMHEDGYWLLEFKMPIMTNLIKMVSRYEDHEKWPNVELMDQYYHRIKRLENTNDPANK